MSIRIDFSKKARESMKEAVEGDRRVKLTASLYDIHVTPALKGDSYVTIQIPMAGLEGKTVLSLTSCDLYDLLQRTFNGTLALINSQMELARALRNISHVEVPSALNVEDDDDGDYDCEDDN